MSTLVPRKPYTDDELQQLYPDGLKLQLVQILMRHGERTPVSARFQNAGLKPFWPYCAAARQMKSAILDHGGERGDAPFTTLEWRRRLETFGENDEPVIATSPKGHVDDICDMGSLTDLGRQSTYKLGLRLRDLYVDRLKFLPSTINSTGFLYLRSTPIPRTLESLQQAFSALYPPTKREPGEDGKFPTPTILTRAPGDETLFPNDSNCRRFAQLSRAFAQRAADRWNRSPDMEYLNKLYGKWMPSEKCQVAVDSRPRLSGIMDSINCTLAHGPETKLPSEFYDKKGLAIIEKIGVEEWFAGYKESLEYRMLGIGGLMGDIVGRMVTSAEGNRKSHLTFGLSGCHDTTLAAVLSSIGAFEKNKWPPFTSHIAIEMFRKTSTPARAPEEKKAAAAGPKTNWWSNLFGTTSVATSTSKIGRKSTTELTPVEKKKLDGYYVRLRYNDEPVTIPGCRTPGNHLDGDESFCTLTAFKEIVDRFTPRDWKEQCLIKAGAPAVSIGKPEWSGH
ncbi:histidine phosphatase superfamily [Lasiosphaeria hispida]|uniref:3-phytase n=1 Tax=Lasiosphaeria hispida TaxID=260671 RepID=A0AAJ0MFN4_9PEZI|nr:histidine phosphatase superfamily [Lasiosphaeria hispida]